MIIEKENLLIQLTLSEWNMKSSEFVFKVHSSI